MSVIQKNIELIQSRIEEAASRSGRIARDIKLIAVSKTKPNEAILEALEAGQIHFGENRMHELQAKMREIQNPGICWHMIGTLQTNKIKYIANRVDWIHSVSKAKYFGEINKRALQFDRTINILIQVNISNEEQKSGCEVDELESILNAARAYPSISVRGLMGMAHLTSDPEAVRGEFAFLHEAFQNHMHLNEGNVQLSELSMGMSNDFEVAIEEGATMVRVGSSIFGARNYG